MTERSRAFLAAKSSSYFPLQISQRSAKALGLHSVALVFLAQFHTGEYSGPFVLLLKFSPS